MRGLWRRGRSWDEKKRTSEEKVTSKSDRVSTFYNVNIFLKLAFFPFFF